MEGSNEAGSEAVCVVIGAGTMGAGIAEVLVGAGASVHLVDSQAEARSRAMARIGDGVSRAGTKRGDADFAAAALARLHMCESMPADVTPRLVVESVPEILELKADVLSHAQELYPSLPVLATNTSALSIDRLASAVAHPDRLIGMHFFNPVPLSNLIEIVVGVQTSEATIAGARDWVQQLGKESIEVRDSPGFATSRLGLALGLEAIRMLEDGVASAADIDLGMVLGYKHPIGPLKLTDLVGLDVRLRIAQTLSASLGERFDPPQLLKSKVAAGELGKKVGRGFYEW